LDNDRQRTSSYFGYYKEIDRLGTDFDCTQKPCWVQPYVRETWLEDICGTDKTNKGVEWDWLSFYWNLWTQNATYKYSLYEFTEVWDRVHDLDPEPDESKEDWEWNHPVLGHPAGGWGLVQAAGDLYSGNKLQQFLDQGSWAGVDH